MGVADTNRSEIKTANQMGSQLHHASFWGDFLAAVEIGLKLRTCTHHPCPGGPTCLGRVPGQLSTED